jgi:cytochrome P450/NADPH-cytochrome P450 reductase
MDPEFPSRAIERLADLYGEIYQVVLGSRVIVVSSRALIDEVSDQDRFHKDIGPTLNEVRALTGDGLFTSAHEDGYILKREPNWWKAHRLLVPAFGPLGLRKMFDDMLDISSQMILRWDRMGPDHAIDASDDFTRLAFDTIGLCSFGYRFNEFYTDDVHPFARQMAEVLILSGRRANRTGVQNALHRWEEQERQENVKKMHGLVQEIIKERKHRPQPDAKDLLNTMLYATDRETGEALSEETVANNVSLAAASSPLPELKTYADLFRPI